MTELDAHIPERRLVLRVLACWREMCGERRFARRSDMTADLIGNDWPHCLGLVLDDPSNPRFDYIGPALQIPGWSWSPATRVSDCHDGSLLQSATSFIPRVLERGIPICIGSMALLLGRPTMF